MQPSSKYDICHSAQQLGIQGQLLYEGFRTWYRWINRKKPYSEELLGDVKKRLEKRLASLNDVLETIDNLKQDEENIQIILNEYEPVLDIFYKTIEDVCEALAYVTTHSQAYLLNISSDNLTTWLETELAEFDNKLTGRPLLAEYLKHKPVFRTTQQLFQNMIDNSTAKTAPMAASGAKRRAPDGGDIFAKEALPAKRLKKNPKPSKSLLSSLSLGLPSFAQKVRKWMSKKSTDPRRESTENDSKARESPARGERQAANQDWVHGIPETQTEYYKAHNEGIRRHGNQNDQDGSGRGSMGGGDQSNPPNQGTESSGAHGSENRRNTAGGDEDGDGSKDPPGPKDSKPDNGSSRTVAPDAGWDGDQLLVNGEFMLRWKQFVDYFDRNLNGLQATTEGKEIALEFKTITNQAFKALGFTQAQFDRIFRDLGKFKHAPPWLYPLDSNDFRASNLDLDEMQSTLRDSLRHQNEMRRVLGGPDLISQDQLDDENLWKTVAQPNSQAEALQILRLFGGQAPSDEESGVDADHLSGGQASNVEESGADDGADGGANDDANDGGHLDLTDEDLSKEMVRPTSQEEAPQIPRLFGGQESGANRGRLLGGNEDEQLAMEETFPWSNFEHTWHALLSEVGLDVAKPENQEQYIGPREGADTDSLQDLRARAEGWQKHNKDFGTISVQELQDILKAVETTIAGANQSAITKAVNTVSEHRSKSTKSPYNFMKGQLHGRKPDVLDLVGSHAIRLRVTWELWSRGQGIVEDVFGAQQDLIDSKRLYSEFWLQVAACKVVKKKEKKDEYASKEKRRRECINALDGQAKALVAAKAKVMAKGVKPPKVETKEKAIEKATQATGTGCLTHGVVSCPSCFPTEATQTRRETMDQATQTDKETVEKATETQSQPIDDDGDGKNLQAMRKMLKRLVSNVEDKRQSIKRKRDAVDDEDGKGSFAKRARKLAKHQHEIETIDAVVLPLIKDFSKDLGKAPPPRSPAPQPTDAAKAAEGEQTARKRRLPSDMPEPREAGPTEGGDSGEMRKRRKIDQPPEQGQEDLQAAGTAPTMPTAPAEPAVPTVPTLPTMTSPVEPSTEELEEAADDINALRDFAVGNERRWDGWALLSTMIRTTLQADYISRVPGAAATITPTIMQEIRTPFLDNPAHSHWLRQRPGPAADPGGRPGFPAPVGTGRYVGGEEVFEL